MLDAIQQLAQSQHANVIAIRRHLHKYPELSFQEEQTSEYIAQQLEGWGISYQKGYAGTGIIAHIQGEKANKGTIALRADMDALPIQEANEVPYKSCHEGVMHACGHDVHTASLLGTAYILHQMRPHFGGQAKLLFQPGEERFPNGASLMIRDGALENPRPQNILAQHVHPPLEVGKIGICTGPHMASQDDIHLLIQGKGGHGALPQNCIDPIAISAQIITALQQLISRYAHPLTPSVLTFGKINSLGGAANVIPNEVKIIGTFRTADESWRSQAHQRIQHIAQGIAESMGAQCQVTIKKGCPVLHNDEILTGRIAICVAQYVGQENVVPLPMRMSSEDFAYYTQHIPGCLYRLGTGNPTKGIQSPVHTDTFDVDEHCLQISTGLMAWLAICELTT